MQIKDLTLALDFAAGTDDIRYHLQGVCIQANRIVTSDGHRLCEVAVDEGLPEELGESIIIPQDAVAAFVKKFSKREQSYRVEIIKEGETYALSSMGVSVYFKPVAGEYPDVDRVINRKYELVPLKHQFNWDYLARAEKSLRKYFGREKDNKFAAVIQSPKDPKATSGIIVYENVYILIMARIVR